MTWIRAFSLAAAAGALSGTLPSIAQGQTGAPPATPRVFFACYGSLTGVVYRIKEPGIPANCLHRTHVQFSWTDGAGGGAGATDHGALGGLADDDHPQYLLGDGTRALTGSLNAGGNKLTNLAEADAAGDAVRFEQAVKGGDLASGDLSGSYPAPSIAKLQGTPLSITTPPSSGHVLTYDGTSWVGAPVPASGSSDHGALTGLSDDDHIQYLRADGTRALAGPLSAGGNKLTNLGAAMVAGDAVPFEQAVKVGDAAGGDLSGSYANPAVAKLQGRAVSNAVPSVDQVLAWNGAAWAPTTPAAGGGTTGQLSVSQFGTAGITAITNVFNVIPGLSATLNVPANAVVNIASNGGFQVNSTSATGFSLVDIVLVVDGSIVPNGGYRRVIAANTASLTGQFDYWSIQLAMPLAPGSHQVQVQASLAAGSNSGATVSGNSTSVLQGALTVTILKL